jgi:hypothetical protein
VFEQILQDDTVERRVFERKLAAGVTPDDLPSAFRGAGNHFARNVNARVAAEVVGEPGGTAAEVEDLGCRREMARDIPEIAGLVVPVRVGHTVARIRNRSAPDDTRRT